MNFFLTIFILSFFYLSCTDLNPRKNTSKGKKSKSVFHTTDPSRLYFNNIRSVSYYREQKPRTRIDIYKLRKFSRDNKRPILYPVIVNNWMEDEAYIFIEKNSYVAYPDSLVIQWQKKTDSGEFFLDIPNKQKQYDFAGQVYKHLRSKSKLSIQNDKGDFIPVFENIEDRNNFITTMNDYYRLVEQ